MAARNDHKQGDTIHALADHMEEIITESDTCLDIVAAGVYDSHRQTRDQATIECQTWPLSEAGSKYAREKGFTGKTMQELLEWLRVNYPLRFKKDPIQGWQKQVARLRSKGNPHTALENYFAFIDHTTQIREALYEAAAAVEREIDLLIDEYRERNRGN